LAGGRLLQELFHGPQILAPLEEGHRQGGPAPGRSARTSGVRLAPTIFIGPVSP
jgi:hypothetical protein